ncbi:MAG: uroporphyrinogen decarboxylase family protein [Candidatus Eisenbacteria bacterium]
MIARERVWAALRGEPVDRPPVSFWGHFYHRESSARELVDATVEHQREFGWDWVKLNPRKHYHVEPWGVSYRYSGRAAEKPVLESWPVHQPGDWAAVTQRPPDRGALGEQIEAVSLLRRELPADVPMVETVFTPLAVLGEMVEEPGELRLHMRTHPNAVRGALEAVTATYERFVKMLLAAGADGIYLATTDWASRNLMSPDDYREWASPFDLRILAAAAGAPFNVLHVCKRRNLLFELADYPVSAFSWDATDPTNPTLADGLARLPGAVMGGISQEEALRETDPERAVAEFRRGLDQTGGRRWLVGPGCSIPPAVPAANLKAVAAAVGSLRPGDDRSGGPAATQEVPR